MQKYLYFSFGVPLGVLLVFGLWLFTAPAPLDLPVGFDDTQRSIYSTMTTEELEKEYEFRKAYLGKMNIYVLHKGDSPEEAEARYRKVNAIWQRCIQLLAIELNRRHQGEQRKGPEGSLGQSA